MQGVISLKGKKAEAEVRTNVMRLLDAAGIHYETGTYEVDENDLSGSHAADLMGIDHDQMYKTLVLKGEKKGYLVCCIPVDEELDLKKVAKAAGEKKVEMIHVKDMLGITGYIRGGCSPIGMKKKFPTYIEETAQLYDTIMVSAGQRGVPVSYTHLIIVTSLTTGMTTDVSSYMFGSILAMTKEDVMLSAVLCIIVLGLFVLCYNQVFAVTFDENFAKATGVNVGAYNMLISVLTAVTIVLGMRMMGAMLISSLVIFPCLTSMRVFKSFTSVVVSSGILSLVCFLLGMMASYQFSMPAGASIVVVNLIAFGLFSMWQVLGKKR